MGVAVGKLPVTEHSMLPPQPSEAAEACQSYEVSASSTRARFKVRYRHDMPPIACATSMGGSTYVCLAVLIVDG